MAQAVVVSFMVRQNLSLEPGIVPWLSFTSLEQIGELVIRGLAKTFYPPLNTTRIFNMTVNILSLTQNRTYVDLAYIVYSEKAGATFASLSAQLLVACGPAQSLAKSLVSQASVSKLAVKQAQITEPTLTNLLISILESSGPQTRSLSSNGLAAIVGCMFAVVAIIIVQHHLLLSDAKAARARFTASASSLPKARPVDEEEREKGIVLTSANPMHSPHHPSSIELSMQQRNSSGSRVAELAVGMSLSVPSQALRLSASHRTPGAPLSPPSFSSPSDSGLHATLLSEGKVLDSFIRKA